MTIALFCGSAFLFIWGLIQLFSCSDLISGIILLGSAIYILLFAILYELVHLRKK